MPHIHTRIHPVGWKPLIPLHSYCPGYRITHLPPLFTQVALLRRANQSIIQGKLIFRVACSYHSPSTHPRPLLDPYPLPRWQIRDDLQSRSVPRTSRVAGDGTGNPLTSLICHLSFLPLFFHSNHLPDVPPPFPFFVYPEIRFPCHVSQV
jgi:hypothetical protein